MMCKECGRLDGLKIMIHEKQILCKQCHAKLNGCKHAKTKVYRNLEDPKGGSYSICKDCGERNEI